MLRRKRGLHKKDEGTAPGVDHGSVPASAAPTSKPPVSVPSFDDDAERLIIGNYQLMKSIGRGAFGVVYRGLSLANAETVAVKRINLQGVPPGELESIEQEIGLLQGLKHPNIVKYRDAIRSDSHLNIVLEYVENGSLLSMISNLGGSASEPLAVLYIAQVVIGLEYLHKQGVIHRDIKAANILSTKSGLVKLADFGVATKLNESRKSTSVVGTPYWMAPEIIEMTGQQSPACDIWSVGCTVIELLTGKPPYFDLQQMPALFRIVQDDHPPLPENITASCKSFLLECFQKDPNRRIDAVGLLKHPWLKDAVQQFNERIRKDNLDDTDGTSGFASGSYGMSVTTAPEDIDWGDDDPETASSLASPNTRGNSVAGGRNGGLHGRGPSRSELSASAAAASAPAPAAGGWQEDDDEDWGDIDRAVNANVAAADDDVAKALQGDDIFDLPDDDDDDVLPAAPRLPPISSLGGAGRVSTPTPTSRVLSRYAENDDDDEWGDAFDGALGSPEPLGGADDADLNSIFSSSPRASMIIASASGAGGVAGASSRVSAAVDAGGKRDLAAFAEDDDDDDMDFGAKLDKLSGDNGDFDLDIDGLDSDKPLTLKLRGSAAALNSNDLDAAFGDDFPFASHGGVRGSGGSGNADTEYDVDPFDDIDFGDVLIDVHTATLARFDRHVSSLTTSASDATVADSCLALCAMVQEHDSVLGSAITRCVIPVLEVLESPSMPSVHAVLCLVNTILSLRAYNSFALNIALAGLIPACCRLASQNHPDYIRLEVAVMIRQFCNTSDAASRMFVSCGGIPALVDLLRSDGSTPLELACIAVDVIYVIFGIDSSPRNDFCRLFCKAGLLPLIAEVLLAFHTVTLRDTFATSHQDDPEALLLSPPNTTSARTAADMSSTGTATRSSGAAADAAAENDSPAFGPASASPNGPSGGDLPTPGSVLPKVSLPESQRIGRPLPQLLPSFSVSEYVHKTAVLLDWFASGGDSTVKRHFADARVLRVIISLLPTLPQETLIVMFKCLRAIVMDTTAMDVLEEVGAIPVLIPFLDSKHMENQTLVLMEMYYLCSLKTTRQEQAVAHGIIPHLQRFIRTKHPLNQFAYPVIFALCKLTSKAARQQLKKNSGVDFYLDILCDPYWRTQALECLATWLADDCQRVEFIMCSPSNVAKVLSMFRTTNNATQLEGMLPAFLRLLTLSSRINSALGPLLLPDIVLHLRRHASNNTIRISLLRVLRQIFAGSDTSAVTTAAARHDVATMLRIMSTDLVFPIVSSLAAKVLNELEDISAAA